MKQYGTYPGTYLKTEPFEERYKIVGEYLKDKIEKPVVVDVNCGEPLFSKYIDYKEYHCNDVYMPDNIDGLNFTHDTDTVVDVKPDVLCIFGYGAGERTKHPQESHTAGETILRLAMYKPEYIVIEMSTEWERRYEQITWFKQKLNNYKIVLEKNVDIPPKKHYHDLRQVLILKIYEN